MFDVEVFLLLFLKGCLSTFAKHDWGGCVNCPNYQKHYTAGPVT